MATKEQIKNGYNAINSIRELGYDIPVPANRQLVAGQRVVIGNLKDCTVVETTPDFKKVIVEYTKVDNNYGNPITTTGCIGGWCWFEVIPENKVPLKSFAVNRHDVAQMISSDVSSLISQVYRRGLIDNTDYQRGYVWTNEDKYGYLETVFEDRDLGKFVFVQDGTYKEYRIEVLDGKQRLNTLLGFVTSQFQYNGYYYHQLSNQDRRLFNSRRVQSATIDRNNVSREDLLKLFLEVNTAGVPQTNEHLNYVRNLLKEEQDNG